MEEKKQHAGGVREAARNISGKAGSGKVSRIHDRDGERKNFEGVWREEKRSDFSCRQGIWERQQNRQERRIL